MRARRKPAGIVGISIGPVSTAVAQLHLRTILAYLDMPTLQQPEFYLGKAAEKFNEAGQLTDPATGAKIDELWTAFTAWIKRFS